MFLSLVESIDRQKFGFLNFTALPFRQNGTQNAFFLVYDVCVEKNEGSEISNYLDADIQVYCLPGLILNSPPLRTVQGLASQLISIIRTIQKKGPYRLAGWGFGGTLAYEMATQLIGEDECIEFLGLFGTNYSRSVNDSYTRIKSQLNDNALLFDNLKKTDTLSDISIIHSLGTEADFAALLAKAQVRSYVPKCLTTDDLRRYLDCWRGYLLAKIEYCPQPISISIHLFVAKRDFFERSYLSWDILLHKEQICLISHSEELKPFLESTDIKLIAEVFSSVIPQEKCNSAILPESQYEPLVPIQTGNAGNLPVFCVPGAGSSSTEFIEMAAAFGTDVPVYGFQPRGLDGSLVPHSTVHAAAEVYLHAISKTYPQGKLHLLGHSFGGWVAFEIAQALISRGRTVASLTLIDTKVPDEDERSILEYTLTDVLMKLIEIYEMSSKQSLEISRQDIDSLEESAQRRLLHDRLIRVGLMPKQSKPESLIGTLRTFGTALRTSYRPANVYTGNVRLVLAFDTDLDEQANIICNENGIVKWKKWAPNLTVMQSKGNHMTMLHSPYVEAIAALILPSNMCDTTGIGSLC